MRTPPALSSIRAARPERAGPPAPWNEPPRCEEFPRSALPHHRRLTPTNRGREYCRQADPPRPGKNGSSGGATGTSAGTSREGITPMSDNTRSDPLQMLRLAREDEDHALGLLLERYRHYLALLARLQIGR